MPSQKTIWRINAVQLLTFSIAPKTLVHVIVPQPNCIPQVRGHILFTAAIPYTALQQVFNKCEPNTTEK